MKISGRDYFTNHDWPLASITQLTPADQVERFDKLMRENEAHIDLLSEPISGTGYNRYVPRRVSELNCFVEKLAKQAKLKDS